MLDMIDTIVCGDARDVLPGIPAKYVQTCITSPPFWGLRDYGLEATIWDGELSCQHEWGEEHVPARGGRNTAENPPSVRANRHIQDMDSIRGNGHTSSFCCKCGAWLGSLGLEPTPELYIDHLVQIFRRVKPVLRDDGTCWVNIGDSYAGSWGNHKEHHVSTVEYATGKGAPVFGKDEGWCPQATPYNYGLKPKDMVLIPFRLALALQRDGWWVRSDIIWQKPNCMPSSVTDRPTTDFDHVFLLAKSKKYYYDNVAIMEPQTGNTHAKGSKVSPPIESAGVGHDGWAKATNKYVDIPGGRNKRTVWTIPTKSYASAHFATFPPKLIEPMILAGSSDKACEDCGAAWVRISSKETSFEGGSGKAGRKAEEVNASGKWKGRQYGKNIKLGPVIKVTTTGFQPSCKCENNTGLGASIVLDPFAGSGTTCAVAKEHRRHWIGIEANTEYIKLAEKRIAEVQPYLL